MKATHRLTMVALLVCSAVTVSSAQDNFPASIKATRAKPSSEIRIKERLKSKFNVAAATFYRPSTWVSPGVPYVDDKAYLRVSMDKPLMMYDASVGSMLVGTVNTNLNLHVFVHGVPGKAQILECLIRDVSQLKYRFQLGSTFSGLTPDPQGRQVTADPVDGVFTFYVPPDVSSLSPDNWFAVRMETTGNPQEAYLTFDGCTIYTVN